MSNIYKIAEKTGFSASTVARTLRGSGYVAEGTRQKILDAAESLGYTPNYSARALRSKKTNKILMCIPDMYNAFYFDMIKGASEILEQHGYYILLCHSKHDPKEETKIINMLKEGYGDGMIFISFDFSDEIVSVLSDLTQPVVATNRILQSNDIDYVYVDHIKATYLAAKHLIQAGHTDIALLTGSTTEQTSRERMEGYLSALRENGILFDKRNLLISDYSRDNGFHVMSRYLKSCGSDRVTAVVACNDLMGMGCLDACHEHGISVPGQLSMVTLDNTDLCTCTTPKLTSIDMRQQEIGRNAALLLLERIGSRRKNSSTCILEPRLLERDSVDRKN